MARSTSGTKLTPGHLVAIVCAAQVLVQIGAFFWPALLPRMMPLWNLNNSEAGWITAIFYAAYMVSVPVLVTLTDRLDAKHVYLFGVGATVVGHLLFAVAADGFWSAMATRALTGMGWAGTYMTGLKLLADQVDAKQMSRATAGHAASIGISGALSFACADLLATVGGWQLAFFAASVSASVAWILVALFAPRRVKKPLSAADGQGLFNFLPVFRNTSAMAYALAYCIHTLEMSALRGWGVAFLAWVAATTGSGAGLFSPTVVLTALGIIGTVASVVGNEAAIRFGRRRLIMTAMVASILIGACLGYIGALSYWAAVGLLLVYGLVVWLDSSSLTAGAAGTADPARRGATLAVHSMLGYAGGFVGPLIVGWVLDGAGGMSRAGWSAAFLSVAVLMALAFAAFAIIRPRELAGDKGESESAKDRAAT
ncbi:MAG: MFS transporter [Hyphomonadaceae bacterium]|nr:MFS transporter [Hyphomonadaceae bacterium]